MWAPESEWVRGGSIPGARLEDLAHWTSACGLLDGTDYIAHGGGGLDGATGRGGGRGEGQDGGEKAQKGAQRYLYCEGTGRRQMHAVPAHVADQVHLGESYKFG